MKGRTVAVTALLAVLLACASCTARPNDTDPPVREEPASAAPREDEAHIPDPLPESGQAEKEAPGGASLPDMTAEEQGYWDTYFVPLLYNGMLGFDWSPEDYRNLSTAPDGRNLSNNLMMAFEDLTGQESMAEMRQAYAADLPAAMVEDTLLDYFPFTREQLREILDQCYSPMLDAYSYEGGRGGGPIEGAVTGVWEEGEFVRLSYVLLFGDANPAAYTGLLTLREREGGYRYWSVEAGDEIPPNAKRDVALKEE